MQSAVDMCRILIEFRGPLLSPFLRNTCNEVIAHQEEEIEYINAWLSARDLTPGQLCSSQPADVGPDVGMIIGAAVGGSLGFLALLGGIYAVVSSTKATATATVAAKSIPKGVVMTAPPSPPAGGKV